MEPSDTPSGQPENTAPGDQRGELDQDLERILGERDRVTVAGGDARTYLHSQITQDITGMVDGESRWTLILEPTGKLVGLARVTQESPERFVLDTDPGFGTGLVERLNRFRIRVAATIELGRSGDGRDRDEARRVALGWPRLGAELIPGETIPAGTGLERIAVNRSKGCYPGQELVERMASRPASAPRSLHRLEVEPGTEPGSAVVDNSGAEIGTITSVVGTRALGWIKRGHEVGQPVAF